MKNIPQSYTKDIFEKICSNSGTLLLGLDGLMISLIDPSLIKRNYESD